MTPPLHPPPAPRADARLQIGHWRVDEAADALSLDGRTVKLEPRTMRLLLALAARPGQVIGSEELLATVWPGLVVTGQSLYQAIGELRQILRADARTGDFIVNVPRKGYRLVAPVARQDAGLPTVAVLPFRDMGLAPGLAFLPETLLGGLILELSRQPDLLPLARGTMQACTGDARPLSRLASELGARYVVDGTLAQWSDALHVECEFVDAATGTVVASEAFSLPEGHWPVLAATVVGRLARTARLEITQHAVRAEPAEASGALVLAMRAWVELYGRPQTRASNDRAWALAAEALTHDDHLGAAWNALAYCEWRAAQYGWSDQAWAPLLAQAVAHAQRATELAPADPDGHYTLGLSTYTVGELERAEASLRHCLAISASYAPAWGCLGLVRAVRGHPEETSALCERALQLSPREPLRAIWHWAEACALSMLGRDELAYERACLGVAANADFPSCHLAAAVSAWRLGRAEAARRHVAALRGGPATSAERLRRTMRALEAEPWASGFLADLQRAGLPAHDTESGG
jgi:DNA-binding winged helix-turn-helix (wHTH) protein/tetratricopeptide (TPR) repeat protein